MLVFVNMLYASVTLFTKYASQCIPFSLGYILGIIGAVCVLGLYALLWQQILKYIELSVAYMFKGVSMVFVLLISAFVFGEEMTMNNLIGAGLVISGIVLYSSQSNQAAE
ncbi:MAG: EamA family transporter [Bacteroidales bacterium]|nr:EamA family transporter [Bacteroidales bacterium]